MMNNNSISENLWRFCPPGEEEAAVASFEALTTPEGASDLALDPPRAQKSPFHHPSRLTLESLDNPFRNSQPTPTHWAVGWADLMMTMFILFLVMYLYPSAREAQAPRFAQEHQDGEAQVVNSDDVETAKLFDLAKLTSEDEEFAKYADIDLSPDRAVRIVLAADLLFSSGQADLRPIAKENIGKISELLKETPHRINVVGHTDDQPTRGGTFATNWELSVMRATSVARFLIEEMGVSASRIAVSGQSFYQPLVSNNSPANREKNRRVEIIVSLDPPPALAVTNPILLSKLVGKNNVR